MPITATGCLLTVQFWRGHYAENRKSAPKPVPCVFHTLPLPDLLINLDDYDRVRRLAERASVRMPYVSAYLERELKRAEVCEPWSRAGVSMGDRVMFRLDDEGTNRLGRLTYATQPLSEKGCVPILGPVGAALIGMHRNSVIEWLDGERTRTLTVVDYGW